MPTNNPNTPKRLIQIAMQLTESQSETLLLVGKAVLERRMIILAGNSNGKSTLIQHLQMNPPEVRLNGIKLGFCLPVFFPEASRASPPSLMRQILYGVGIRTSPGIHNTLKAFQELLLKLHSANKVGCISIDGISLSRQACESIQIVNSGIHACGRTIGLGVIAALDSRSISKLPSTFRKRCYEIEMQRVRINELHRIATNILGPELRLSKASIESLDRCLSLLEIKDTLVRAATQSKLLRLNTIDRSLIEAVIRESTSLKAAA
jgi:hypothetical protein